ncbi:MAG: cyclic nucleotide-binding domain-containing protein [Planctomycetes bacterium]|nr:cyclic nucleotide-binding domain-containing protein [Planctomycetota bacterium]MBI3846181.1 cyclic nucleotide-binding domain-containing protein [Planctomycetota bacterium]
MSVQLTIDGKPVTVPDNTTIWEAARSVGIAIPVLCHQPNMNPAAVCRVCAVDVGARVYAASCIRAAENNMVVTTHNDRLDRARRTLVELLLADHPRPCARHREFGDCELELLAEREGVVDPIFPARATSKGLDLSNPNIAVDHSACILCDRCVRACTDIRHNDVIGRMAKGYAASISFDDNLPMGKSSCVDCGECLVSCPTGALTAAHQIGTKLTVGEPMTADALMEFDVFSGVSSAFLTRNAGGVVKRRYKKGELICREGEPGSTAFYVLEGKVEVYLGVPLTHVKTHSERRGWIRRMVSSLASRKQDARPGENTMRFVPVDASIDLAYDNPRAVLGKGELFGEGSCMNLNPRSATVRAAEDCVVLEMLRNVLQILQKNRQFKARLDETYRKRSLDNHLRSVDVFRDLPPEFVEYLRDRVELVRFAAGDVICRQGDPADAFYLVRLGHVKVTQSYPGGELVRAYLSRGNFFGEMGLLGDDVRSATCSALDHVEVVRVSKEDFETLLVRFPEVRARLEAVAQSRRDANAAAVLATQSQFLDDYLEQGLMEAQSLLILDLEKCVRCDECVKACASAHQGVTRLIRDGLRYDKYLVATSCRTCRDPLCMTECPVTAIRRRDSLEIVIEDWCVGCNKCAENCPYGNINLHEFPSEERDPLTGERRTVRKATVCDLCTEHKEPSCVYACPHDAAHRVDPTKPNPYLWVGSIGIKESSTIDDRT